jgi:ribosomal protein S12 methylthiotransferase accessory factor YcaO
MTALNTLKDSLHLPIVELFTENLCFNGARLALAGCTGTVPNGAEIIGSAVEIVMDDELSGLEAAKSRAHMEFAERFAVNEWFHRQQNSFAIYDIDRKFLEIRTEHKQKSRVNETPSWKPALSNGVAAHTNWRMACRAAALEIYERDRLMRAWFFGLARRRLCVDARLLAPFHPSHEVEIFELGSPFFCETLDAMIYTRLCIAWPRTPEAPLAIGSASGTNAFEALGRSIRESIQVAAFLDGATWEPEEYTPSPTPLFHQAHFQQTTSQVQLRQWTNRGALWPDKDDGQSSVGTKIVGFASLTPSTWKGEVEVAKAIAPELENLFFGIRPELSENQPHPFA